MTLIFRLIPMILIVIFVSQTGCRTVDRNEDHRKQGLSYVIDFSNVIANKKRVLLSDIAQEVKYIPLETTHENQLDQISKIIVLDSSIYITDQYKLLKFSINGDFIEQIGKIGRGPGEYLSVFDFEIDDSLNNIYILDGQNPNILKYDLEGNFIERISTHLDINADQFLFLGRGRFANYTTDFSRKSDTIRRSLLITDLKFNPIKRFPNRYVQRGVWTMARTPLYLFNKKVYFKENFNDTLYCLNEDKLEPFSILTLGTYQLDPNLSLSELKKTMKEESSKLNIHKIIESNQNVFVQLKYGYHSDSSLCLLYDKERSYSVVLTDQGFFNNIDHGVSFWPKFMCKDEIYIDYRDAFSFKSEIKKNSSNSLKQLGANIKETDNPILIFVKLKK